MKEHIKTILLILLILTAMFLLVRTWVYDNRLLADERYASNPLLSFLLGLEYKPGLEKWAPVRQEYGQAAVTPARCSVLRDGERTGAQYDADTKTVYTQFSLLLSEALGTAGSPAVLSPDEWKGELLKDGVYFSFSGAVPIKLLSVWLSADGPDAGDITAIGLTLDDRGVGLIWKAADGSYLRAETGALFDKWPELPELRPCGFAFESEGSSLSELAPDQLFTEDGAYFKVSVSDPPDIWQETDVYAAFLEALDLPPMQTPSYPRGGARVFISEEGGRSCEIAADGAIRYVVNAPLQDQPGVPPEAIAPAGEVLFAWELLSRLTPAMGDARFELYRVTETAGGYTITFIITAGGIPLLWEPAEVIIRENAVQEITLRLCRAEIGPDEEKPISPEQAAVLCPAGSILELRYAAAEDGTAPISWVVVQ